MKYLILIGLLSFTACTSVPKHHEEPNTWVWHPDFNY